MARVKIISGHSNPGGSSVANINLCNLFNSRGIDTTFYGPDDWHLDQCKAGKTGNLDIHKEDVLIVHYLVMPERPDCRKLVLSCHETALYPIREIECFWDQIHYVSDSQRKWHGIDGVVIPNRITPLERRNTNSEIAGVVGSIDNNKQTHVSIKRALNDGYNKVFLYGELTDQEYYTSYVKGYVDSGKAVLKGFENDKQAIYDSIDVAYNSSKSETFNLIRAECNATGTEYHGSVTSDPDVPLFSDEDIFSEWMRLLEIT